MNQLKVNKIGVFYAFLSAGFFSMFNLSIRFSEPYLTVWHMLFGRCLIGLVTIPLMAKWFGLNLLGYRRKILLLIGVTNSVAIICMVTALILLPLFEVLVLFYLYSVFAALFSPRITGERLLPSEWLLIGLAFCGMILILWSGHLGYGLQWGHLICVTAAFGYGLTLTLIRLVSPKNNPFTPIFYFSAVGSFVCLAPLLFQEAPFQIGIRGIVGVLAITTLALAATLASNKALVYLSSPKVGLISMSELVLGAVFGYFLFNEQLTWRTLIGAVLVVGSGFRLSVKPMQESPEPADRVTP